MAAMVVETAWLMSSAMLMPLERMRVGINSESASQTHTPGPTAKNDMKTKRQIAVNQPFRSSGMGVMSAFSIFSGAFVAAAKFANGCDMKTANRLVGTKLSRVISTGFAVWSSERMAVVAP